jgi:tRNA U34 5-carboxymethylaminomethyl modifying GTPase MnmE/TrmE
MSGRVMSHVSEALKYMREARELVETNMPEIASIDIERSARHIGAILGRADVSEDVLDKLFSTFCVGK